MKKGLTIPTAVIAVHIEAAAILSVAAPTKIF